MTTATVTVSTYTTYCPSATTIVSNGQTYSATSSGYISIPVISTSTGIVAAPPPTTPITLGATASKIPSVMPTTPTTTVATTSAPAVITGNAANNLGPGFGALVAGGLAAMLF